jgi:WD40 repeat protein
MDWPTTGQVWDTTTGKTVFTSPALYTGVLQDVAWFLDGERMAFTTLSNVNIWDITGGHFWTSPSFASESTIIYYANIMVSSPERKYTAGDNDNEVLIWEIPYP